MLKVESIMEALTGRHPVQSLIQEMAEQFEDFAADRQRYLDAMEVLRKELGDAVTDVADAIEVQCVSNMLFSGWLGFQANLEHFIDPVARNFLEVDFEVYLREEMAHALPQYECAHKTIDQFDATLTPAQKCVYEAVSTYISHLETIVPKLAHYYGFMLGNELLGWLVPGYHKDLALTLQYTDMLNRYFGKSFIHDM